MSQRAMEPVNLLQTPALNISKEYVNRVQSNCQEAIMSKSSSSLARTLRDDHNYIEISAQKESEEVRNEGSNGKSKPGVKVEGQSDIARNHLLENKRVAEIRKGTAADLHVDYLSDISSDSFHSFDNLETPIKKEYVCGRPANESKAFSNWMPHLPMIKQENLFDQLGLEEISSNSIHSGTSSEAMDNLDHLLLSSQPKPDDQMSNLSSLDSTSKSSNMEIPLDTKEDLSVSIGNENYNETAMSNLNWLDHLDTSIKDEPISEEGTAIVDQLPDDHIDWKNEVKTENLEIAVIAQKLDETARDESPGVASTLKDEDGRHALEIVEEVVDEIVEMSMLQSENSSKETSPKAENTDVDEEQGDQLIEVIEEVTEESEEVIDDLLTLPSLIPIKSNRHSDILQRMPELIPINKHNRLQMAQLIEKKLQSNVDEGIKGIAEKEKIVFTVEEATPKNDSIAMDISQINESPNEFLKTEDFSTNIDLENASNDCEGDWNSISRNSPEIKKPPLIGCIRKSKRRSARPTKPPWLQSHSNDEDEDEDDVEVEAEPKLTDEEESSDDSIPEANNLDATDDNSVLGDISKMREKLFSQLQMLKVKRKSEPLVSTSVIIQNCSNVYYEKRSVKPLILSSDNPENESPFGIKIVAVAGGVDIDNCEGLVPVDSHPNDAPDDVDMEEEPEETDKPMKEVIINEHLDLPTIKLTKTKDYTKIKGWNKKKLLAQNEENTEDEIAMDVESTPSCSYPVSNIEEATCAEGIDPEDLLEDTDEITMTVPEVQEINVFASNNLEGFLQEKDLNISYNVPNLKSTNHNINLLDNCVLVDINQERKSIENEDSNSSSSFKEQAKEVLKSDAPKPRTLAEKRKMLLDETVRESRFSKRQEAKRFRSAKFRNQVPNEIVNVEEELLVPMSKKPVAMHVDTPADCLQCRDIVFLSAEKSKPKETFISQLRFRARRGQLGPYSVVSRKAINRSYWWRYSDVPRKSSIQYIPKEEKTKPRKVSILKTLSNVEYKPGPLSKKDQLQTKGQCRWKTVITDLPKVVVDVTPEIGKVIHPAVRPFVQFNAQKISEERADFAVSMLRHKNCVAEAPKTFTFPAHYEHHQEKAILRQLVGPRSTSWTQFQQDMPENEQQTMRTIENIIDQMLDYVELKQHEDTFIKEDPTLAEPETDDKIGDIKEEVAKTSPEEDALAKANAEAKKRTLERTLKTLNVLVVDLPGNQTAEVEDCTKAFCRLGCVCQSISGKYPPAEHCGEPKCILQCVCGFELSHRRLKEHQLQHQKEQQPDLNEKTISRLQKEAKRNITAREERDFTLTAIRSADNTYIFNRSRRTPKYNYKKYEGFHVNFTEELRKLQDDPKIFRASVDVIRCDFSELVPYCLVHDLYDCHCKCLAEFDQKERSHVDRLWVLKTWRRAEAKRLKEAMAALSASADEASDSNERSSKLQHCPPYISQPQSDNVVPALRSQPTPSETYDNAEAKSARLRGTGVYYLFRNKTNTYKIKMARRLKYDKTVDQEIVNKWYILPSHSSVPVSDQKRQILANQNTHRRKQELKIRSISDINLTLEKPRITDAERLMKQISTQNSPGHTQKARPRVGRESLRSIAKTLAISGALYAPTLSISQKFAQMIGNRQATSEFRLLLWPSLSLLFSIGDIQIWFNNTNNKLRFVVTDSVTTPKGGYDNVKMFEGKTDEIKADFIKWIVTDKLPENKQAENILVILKMNECYWEICGICAKSPSGEQYAKVRNDILEKHRQTVEKQQRKRLHLESVGNQASPVKATEEVTPVDEKYYKCSQQVYFCHGIFGSKSLTLSDMNDTRVDAEAEIIVSLPRAMATSRWRVLKINSSFAILAFANRSFNIKCSDILKVMGNASKHNRAIIIKSPECFVGYMSKAFGIYVAPNFHDRIFIGPYEMDEDHRIETLRFVNNKLIHLEVFNAMRGHKNIACTGVWYTQQAAPLMQQVGSVIDLTEMDEVKHLIKSQEVTITPTRECMRMPLLVAEGKENDDNENSSDSISVDSPPTSPIHPFKPCKMNNGHTSEMANPASAVKPGSSLLADKNKTLFKLPKPLPKTQAKNVVRSNMGETDGEMVVPTLGFPRTPLAKLQQEMDAIVQQARIAGPAEIGRLFHMKLFKLMESLDLHAPHDVRPMCFRLNFGNGIILGFSYKTKIFAFWPGAKMPRIEFDSVEEAVDWLQRELHAVFICVPSNFKIIVAPVGPSNYIDYIQRNVISQKYFHEVCIIGDFGIMRLNEAEPYLLAGTVDQGRLKVQEANRSDKFKKAISSILDKNDMSKRQFLKKVSDLVQRAKAAADRHVKRHSAADPSATIATKPQASTSLLIKNQNVHIDAKRFVQLPPNQLISVGNDLLPLASVAQNSAVAPASNVKSVHTPLRLSDVRAITQPVPRLAPLGPKKDNVMRIDLAHMNIDEAKILIKRVYGVDIKELKKITVKRQLLSEGSGSSAT